MHLLSNGLFWGFILILLGISVIIKAIFKIDIPLVKIIFALLLIYWGLKLLFGFSFHSHSEENIVFQKSQITASKSKSEYNIVFGSGDIDLKGVDISQGNAYAEVNIVFGSGDVYIDPAIPALIKISSVFAETKLPKRTITFLGDYVYKTENFDQNKPYLYIKLDVIFGNARVKQQ